MMYNAQISLLLLIWRKVQAKKYDKNDRIDEEKSEGEKTDSVSTTVNDAECTDLNPSVDMEEGVGKRKDDENDRIAKEKDDNDEKNDDEKEA